MKSKLNLIMITMFGAVLFTGCNSGNINNSSSTPLKSPTIEEKNNEIQLPSSSTKVKDSPYTKEELENDRRAPSKNVNDYNSEGQYVPENGISDNTEDYNADGECKPVENMTREEMREELENMFENSLEY